MTRQIIIVFILTLVGCNSPTEKPKNIVLSDSVKIMPDNNTLDISRINFTDVKGLKQGKWVKSDKKNITKEILTYKNDTLNGHYYIGSDGWRREGIYKNGLYDGYQWVISGNLAQYYSFYQAGKFIWAAYYAADHNNLFPIKGFRIAFDSTYIKAPHYNGKLWYEGLFIFQPNQRNPNFIGNKPVGVHKIYFETGELKGIVDYNKRIISEYKKTGKKLYITSFDNIGVHKQTMISDVK